MVLGSLRIFLWIYGRLRNLKKRNRVHRGFQERFWETHGISWRVLLAFQWCFRRCQEHSGDGIGNRGRPRGILDVPRNPRVVSEVSVELKAFRWLSGCMSVSEGFMGFQKVSRRF